MRRLPMLLLVTLLACGQTSDDLAPETVTGLITGIRRGDRGPIEAFTVEDGGARHEIRIDPRRDYGFELEHLEEHRVQELPVRVTLEERDAGLFAVEILDA